MYSFKLFAVTWFVVVSDRVAGELSDALTSAFSMDNNDAGGDSYNFDEHF
jgi:hypothetical protein